MNAEEASETEHHFHASIDFEASRAELERLLADPEFHCTDRNKSFLRFVADALFKGRGESIKAYTVAVDVFGRPASFDPTTDPIVRIEATRLRACLSSYYDLRAKEGSVRIDLPKGRYVPVFSTVVSAPDAYAHASPAPGGLELLSPQQPADGSSRLRPSTRARWTAATAGIAGGVLLGAALLIGFVRPGGEPVVSEKPFVQLDMKLTGGPTDAEAERLRDALMVALSRFQTLRVMATADDRGVPGVSKAGGYRITMKYGGPSDRSVWWQIVDLASGEALRTDVEKIAAAPFTSSDSVDALVNRLAVRFAGVKGLVNNLETAREVNNPTLGNGCVLRASLAIDAADATALKQVQNCIERTLALRPSDADAHATLSAVLLALDRPDAPTELTQRALEFADRAVALAPDSARSATAKMMAEFRSGGIEAAIQAGRRAIELNPLNASAKAKLGNILFAVGQWEDGISLVMQAGEIEEYAPRKAELTLAFDAYRRGEYGEALAMLEQHGPADCYRAHLLEIATLGQLGRSEEADEAMDELQRAWPGFGRYFRPTMARWQFAPTLVASLQAGLEKAGLQIQ